MRRRGTRFLELGLRHLTRRHGLSSRQHEIADLAMAGYSSPDIASALGISTRVVKAHRNAVYRKVGVDDLHELTIMTIGAAVENSGAEPP